MKRIILAFTLLACLLFVGCGKTDGEKTESNITTQTKTSTQAETESTTKANSTDKTKASTETKKESTTTKPTPTQPETVTVYLLKETFLCDNGPTKFYYDKNHNISYYNCLTMEGSTRYNRYFEEQDANGMPCKIRTEWPGGDTYSSTLTYFADGKIESELEDGSNFTGYQYAYDQKGDLIEKREYYDGILQTSVIFQYDGETLTDVHCEDSKGNLIYDCQLKNGRIMSENHYDAAYAYGYTYKYDKNGNLISKSIVMDGETQPLVEYSYKAVKVDYDRAGYLQQQQKYLLSIS